MLAVVGQRTKSVRPKLIVAAFSLCAVLNACGSRDTASPVQSPGAPKGDKTTVLEKAAGVVQAHPPIAAINAYLDGFHFYSGKPDDQMEAHHYCAVLNDELIQCVIYDGNTADAKLMGVEYIVSARLYAALPAAEQTLWHSHVHEVKSGQLIAPGIPQIAEHELMEKLVHTYGKTWHTWHTNHRDALPMGVPQLMMGFTADGQINEQMVRERDQRFEVSSNERRRLRKDIEAPPINPAADAWQRGHVIQIEDPTGSHRGSDTPAEPRVPSR